MPPSTQCVARVPNLLRGAVLRHRAPAVFVCVGSDLSATSPRRCSAGLCPGLWDPGEVCREARHLLSYLQVRLQVALFAERACGFSAFPRVRQNYQRIRQPTNRKARGVPHPRFCEGGSWVSSRGVFLAFLFVSSNYVNLQQSLRPPPHVLRPTTPRPIHRKVLL